MASAAVTAASAAAALVPFEVSLGCLPAKGVSRNFLFEWPVVLPYFDGYDLLGHRSSHAMVGGSLD
jgi:hypothetical protein